MRFDVLLEPDREQIYTALGQAAGVDTLTAGMVEDAAALLLKAAVPRWVYARFELRNAACLPTAKLELRGDSIRRHLEGCDACVLAAVTLGEGVERRLRALEAVDMARTVVLDVAASTLVEQYADYAEAELRAAITREGLYLTGRFSPGYGDFPLEQQGDFVRLLDTQRKIGLSVTASNILVPRKSITAVLGVAAKPVRGRPAGCEDCALNGSCGYRSGGGHCGKTV